MNKPVTVASSAVLVPIYRSEYKNLAYNAAGLRWNNLVIVQASCSKKDYKQVVYDRNFSGRYRGPKLLYNQALA